MRRTRGPVNNACVIVLFPAGGSINCGPPTTSLALLSATAPSIGAKNGNSFAQFSLREWKNYKNVSANKISGPTSQERHICRPLLISFLRDVGPSARKRHLCLLSPAHYANRTGVNARRKDVFISFSCMLGHYGWVVQFPHPVHFLKKVQFPLPSNPLLPKGCEGCSCFISRDR